MCSKSEENVNLLCFIHLSECLLKIVFCCTVFWEIGMIVFRHSLIETLLANKRRRSPDLSEDIAKQSKVEINSALFCQPG